VARRGERGTARVTARHHLGRVASRVSTTRRGVLSVRTPCRSLCEQRVSDAAAASVAIAAAGAAAGNAAAPETAMAEVLRCHTSLGQGLGTARRRGRQDKALAEALRRNTGLIGSGAAAPLALAPRRGRRRWRRCCAASSGSPSPSLGTTASATLSVRADITAGCAGKPGPARRGRAPCRGRPGSS